MNLRVDIGPPIEVATSRLGIRRTVPINGGTFSGPQISGRVLPGGADWQLVENDGLTFVDAHYEVETNDRVRIAVRNQGVRYGAPEVLARIAAGERVAPEEYYFRTSPRFFSPGGRYERLKGSVFVGTRERYEELVIVRVWKVA